MLCHLLRRQRRNRNVAVACAFGGGRSGLDFAGFCGGSSGSSSSVAVLRACCAGGRLLVSRKEKLARPEGQQANRTSSRKCGSRWYNESQETPVATSIAWGSSCPTSPPVYNQVRSLDSARSHGLALGEKWPVASGPSRSCQDPIPQARLEGCLKAACP